MTLHESDVEEAALAWFEELGYQIVRGATQSPDDPHSERQDYRDLVLVRRLRDAVFALNPDLPQEALDDAIRQVTRPNAFSLIGKNHAFHQMLVDGVGVEYRRADGTLGGARVRLVDFESPDRNDWLVINQFTVVEGQHNRRPDLVVFVNGLPLAVVELKNVADENATVWTAFNQLQTYKQQVATPIGVGKLGRSESRERSRRDRSNR